MSKSKRNLLRIIISIPFLVASLVLEYVPVPSWCKWLQLGLSLVGYLVIGYDVLWSAVRRIARGSFLDENFLMSIASIGAFVIGEYPEALAVMLFYQVGEYFEHQAVAKSRKSIRALLAINVDTARLQDGSEVECNNVEIGTIISIRAGERIPLDGVVKSGEGYVDTSALTGESVPVFVHPGDEVMSGCILLDTTLLVETTKVFEQSTASRMIRLVEEARDKKAPVENFITTFAKYYTPIVVFCALIVGLVPPLFLGISTWPVWAEWLKRAMIFLVVSCPCALVISIPLSYFGAIGKASKLGILVKGGHVFAALKNADTFVFDKTGTITLGAPVVSEVYPMDKSDQILSLALTVEASSNHPLAKGIVSFAQQAGARSLAGYHIKEERGKGMIGEGDSRILVGNGALLLDNGISFDEQQGTVLYVAKDQQCLGYIRLVDDVKPMAQEVIAALNEMGETYIVSGDRRAIVEEVASRVGCTDCLAECLPSDKVAKIESLQEQGKKVLFVGDGINDAPVITAADVGVAMGGIGQDAAIESADVVLMTDNLQGVMESKKIAAKTQRIVKQNICFALFVKSAVMALSLTPLSVNQWMMWLAVGADVGVAILAILNAMRTASKK